MKKILFTLLFTTSFIHAQYSSGYDKLFLEAGIGIARPLSDYSPSGDNVPLSFFHFQGGMRYMFNKDVVLLATLAFDQFNHGNQKNDQKLAALEFCYNLGNGIGLSRDTDGKFGLFVHAGAGAGIMSSRYNNRDYIGALLIGARPFIAVNDKVSFFADLTYKATLEQNLYFNGSKTKTGITGNQLGLTFGLMVSLGGRKFHADMLY
jgi:hypothetical protein